MTTPPIGCVDVSRRSDPHATVWFPPLSLLLRMSGADEAPSFQLLTADEKGREIGELYLTDSWEDVLNCIACLNHNK